MQRGLILKSLRETWLVTLLFAIGLFIFEALIAWIVPRYYDEVAGQIFRLPFLRDLVGALLGTKLEGDISIVALSSIAWVHPVVLALLWTHEITLATRLPAAEIEHGTVDSLLSLPISRWQAYISETFVWASSGLVLLLAAWLGHRVGGLALPPESRPPTATVLWTLANLWLLYAAVGAFACWMCAVSNRRSHAIGLTFSVVVASFVLNFLTQLWEAAKSVEFLGLLSYYRPLEIVQNGHPAGWQMLVLLWLTVIFWVTGGILFARRDITTT